MNKILALILSFFSFQSHGSDPKEAYSQMQEKKAVIIDVREEEEIKAGMVKDVTWFPLSKINQDPNWKEEFQKIVEGKKIFLYCRSGVRSGKVQEILKQQGIPSENIGGFLTLKDELPTQ